MKQTFTIAGVGELLWDLLPSGKQLGGATLNFAFHAAQFGCRSAVVSAVGNDPYGLQILEKLQEAQLSTAYEQQNDYPTGTVDVRLDARGVPSYTIHKPVAWDFIAWNEGLERLAPQLDAVCFGTLGQRGETSAATIRKLLSHVNKQCLKVFDINLRQDFYSEETVRASLEQADILKLNEDELPVVAGMLSLHGDADSQLEQLRQRYDLRYIVYTLGSRGSRVTAPDDFSVMETAKVEVADTVGAGDSFTAAFVAGILQGRPLHEAHRRATETAAFVCTQAGGTPVLPDSLIY